MEEPLEICNLLIKSNGSRGEGREWLAQVKVYSILQNREYAAVFYHNLMNEIIGKC